MSVEDDMHLERQRRQMMEGYEREAMMLRSQFKADKSGRYDLADPVLKKAIQKAAKSAGRGAARKIKEAALWAIFGKKR